MNQLIQKADTFALAAHSAVGQLRKYTFDPYIVHPRHVANIIREHVKDYSPAMIAAALLHDVLEDTQVTEPLLRDQFGDDVVDLVAWLTNVSKPSDGNRKKRKELDKLNLSKAPADAQTIKLADLISNTSSIVQYDKKFAKVYIPEKKELLTVLTKGDTVLYNIALGMIMESEAILSLN